MYVKNDLDFEDLKNNCWSGAVDTLETIENAEKEEEFMDYLEMIYCDEIPTMTELNDFLWFDSERIFADLEINEDEEDEEDEE